MDLGTKVPFPPRDQGHIMGIRANGNHFATDFGPLGRYISSMTILESDLAACELECLRADPKCRYSDRPIPPNAQCKELDVTEFESLLRLCTTSVSLTAKMNSDHAGNGARGNSE
jgi:hypothetical protein